MAQPYPISREAREEAVNVGSGVATYGPFDLKIFDIEDVEIWTRPAAGGPWSLVSVVVTKTAGAAFDTFSITFPAPITSATQYKVLGARVPARSAGVTSGTKLDPDALEKELSKIAAALQELRRDVGRGIQVQFGAGYTMADDLPDGATLMRSGGRIVEGPDASEIQAAQGYSVTAGLAAVAAQLSAEAAATFDPANFYDKIASDFRYYTKTAADALLAAKADASTIKWLSKAIGEFYFADDGVTGVDIPPTDNPAFRFVELTAGLGGVGQYNNGCLTAESVSGSAPLVLATAQISLAGSPMSGQTIRLLNTERRILRPGAVGTLENDALQNITGSIASAQESFSAPTGAFALGAAGAANRPNNGTASTNGLSFDASLVARTSTETRMKNIGVRIFRRIK